MHTALIINTPTNVGFGPTDPGSNPGPATRKDSFFQSINEYKTWSSEPGFKI